MGEENEMVDKVRTGILGYGLSGSVFHAPLLSALEDYEIRKVMTSRKEQVKQDLPEAEAVSTIEDITKDPDIDLVIVTTPAAFITKWRKSASAPESMSFLKSR